MISNILKLALLVVVMGVALFVIRSVITIARSPSTRQELGAAKFDLAPKIPAQHFNYYAAKPTVGTVTASSSTERAPSTAGAQTYPPQSASAGSAPNYTPVNSMPATMERSYSSPTYSGSQNYARGAGAGAGPSQASN